ncbi:MAG: HIT family protein [Bacteroidales bacterium]|nr:HIT family protein [Bacteroidales bacterium]
MKEKEQCPFCAPEIRESVFDESEHFMAIYNLAPILPGHSMIIPKTHYSGILELPKDHFIEMMLFSREVVKLLTKAFNTSSFNWTVQEKEPAGQTLEHLHLHIIPRKTGDLQKPGDWFPEMQKSEEQLIDSELRPRLSGKEMQKRVAYIKQFKSSHKED